MKQVGIGTVFQGKWTQQSFKIAKLLGEGANGAVYLVYTKQGYAAMKVCEAAADAALEWHVLEKVSQVRSSFPRPILIDDWERQNETIYFYIMEWVPGEPLEKILPKLTNGSYEHVVEQIVLGLQALHQAGMAFCDIKPQNILVATDGALSVRFVDVGGVTVFGRSVRQFTPISDRAFWDFGSRRAEPAYDVCGLCLSLVLSQEGTLPKNIYQLSPEQRRHWLNKALRRYPHSSYTPLLRDGLTGHIADAGSFLKEWHSVTSSIPANRKTSRRRKQKLQSSAASVRPANPRGTTPTAVSARSGQHAGSTALVRSRRRKVDWTEWVMWASLTTAVFMTCFAWATFLGWVP